MSTLLAMEPCYGLSSPQHVEGEHVWVEYDEANISQATATEVAGVADDAWDYYVDTFAWPAPPEPISVDADFSNDSAFGQCITLECEGVGDVPRCAVFGPAFAAGAHPNTTAHEIGHAFEYGLMGFYVDSLGSWAWWMEGTAEYMAYKLLPVQGTRAVIETYLGNPEWTLHHTFSEFIDGTRVGHMYGTAALAMFIDEYYGGPETVRQTWEWGAAMSGEPIYFGDAIEGIGLDFDTFWPDYLAHISVVDLEVGPELDTAPVRFDIGTLPGSADTPDAFRPEGLGMTFARFPAALGEPGGTLRVRVLGDPDVRWQGALALVDGTAPGSSVLDHVGGQSGDDGALVLELANFDGDHDVMLGVSPESLEKNPFAFGLEAELVFEDDSPTTGDDPREPSTSTAEDESGGDTDGPAAEGDTSGCATSRGSQPLAVLILLGLWTRRRKSSGRVCMPSSTAACRVRRATGSGVPSRMRDG